MSEIRDGGPAFPKPIGITKDPWGNYVNDDSSPASGGMTYRQWLAGKAMQGLMHPSRAYDASAFDQIAADAWSMADAMIAAEMVVTP